MNEYRVAAVALLVALGLPTAVLGEPRPDALLVVDRHREAIVDRTIAAWPVSLSPERTEALRKTLWSLRADELLAVSLSPGDARIAIDQATPDADAARVRAKALGDLLADLVYTPLTPCRIVDTRNAVGALSANVTRTLLGYHASSFAAQGGTATSCGIPNGVAALSMNVYAVNPSNLGFVKLWASNQSEPAVSTVNYEPPTVAIATGAIVPVNAGDNNRFNAKSPAGVHLVVDVVGYFRPAFATGHGLRVIQHPTIGTANTLNGASLNGVGAGVRGATIAGGGVMPGTDPDVPGAGGNLVGEAYGTIGGGTNNSVADGIADPLSAMYGTIGGGRNNQTLMGYATIGGGQDNLANGSWSTIAGGRSNATVGHYAVIGGGWDNAAMLSGVVPGGFANVANGTTAFAAGHRAKASYDGAFLWADSTNLDFKVQSSEFAGPGSGWSDATNTFNVRATGGVWMVTAVDGTTGRPTAGAFINSGSGTWSPTSDRDAKSHVRPVDPREMLDKVVALPVSRWRYMTEHDVDHIGPMAQDFHAAFGVGPDERSITTIDADGVALAAIQGLNAKLESTLAARDREIARLEGELAAIKEALKSLVLERR